ncbi:hypothetical protein [Lysinibacillus parviboronicapiens]|uniref:hypothetical protein n=1 Tax=Lysinibacillus parviboronicapiens TaxID=436516 RepID=UPI000D3614A2|nr:hypothetical protein [Lysinibacillus parviboronicapiens]
MKLAIDLLQESKKTKLFDLETIHSETDKCNNQLTKLNKKKEKLENEISEIDKAISKLQGNE